MDDPDALESRRKRADDARGLDADADNLAHETDDALRIVGAVRVGAGAALRVFVNLTLVDNPFQGAAVAKAVVEGFGRNARKGKRGVYAHRGPVPRDDAGN